MELESYIDRLNNTIEGLESEELTITNNIINLKIEYNKEKLDYDSLKKKIEEEEGKYGALLMKNVRLTTQQNKEVIEKISQEQEEIKNMRINLTIKETELFTKMSEICAKEKDLHRKELYLGEIEKKVRASDTYNILRERTMKLDEEKLHKLIEENRIIQDQSDAIIQRNKKIEDTLKKDLQIFQKKRELHEQEHIMKMGDLERREGEIQKEKLKIESEWKALKQAKEHIDNLKQGNQ